MEAPARSYEDADRGRLIAQLSREIVQLHARMYGRGPTRARSYLQRDYGLCVLEEIFTQAERTLIENGSAEHVRDTRLKFQDAVGEQFVSIAERVVGRPVRSFMSQVDTDNDMAAEIFIFGDDSALRGEPGNGPSSPSQNGEVG